MDHFADHFKAAAKHVSETSLENNRALIRTLSSYDRLDLNRALVILKANSQDDSVYIPSRRRTTFQKSLRVVAPGQFSEVDAATGTQEQHAHQEAAGAEYVVCEQEVAKPEKVAPEKEAQPSDSASVTSFHKVEQPQQFNGVGSFSSGLSGTEVVAVTPTK
uniref:Uncharacterized protein n=1 Tax=Alexandrium andersonii TaxID=327968 RepID=A0A7S2F6H5_9DINO